MKTKYWEDIDLELYNALSLLPEVPSLRVLKLLSESAYAMPPHVKNRGNELQRKHGLEKIPPVSEMEWAAGLWIVIREAILREIEADD